MKRKFFATLAMFILVLAGAFSPVFSLVTTHFEAKIAYAQTPPTGTTDPTPEEKAKAEAEAKQKEGVDCGTNFICGGIILFAYFIQFVPNLLAEVSGMTLDYAVWKNLQSSTWTEQDKVESFVVKGWKLMRDFANLLFIFALFIVAFSLILNGAGTGEKPLFGLDPKRTIARVILMALLINFSFFMCRVIIDMTNSFGNVFYSKITIVDAPKTTGSSSQVSSDATKDDGYGSAGSFYTNFGGIRSVSFAILGNIDPQQLILASGTKIENKAGFFGKLAGWKSYDASVYIKMIFVSWLVGIFDFFLIYLFISSSIFLFSRIFGLYFLIILSPIAFVSTTVPALQNKEYFGFDDWFKQLTGLAFCLPIYLFFVWLALFFLKIEVAVANDSMIALATVIIVKLFTMGAVLILGKKVAQDLSGKIGAMATNAVTGVVTGAAMLAGAAVTGGASAALRMGGSMAKNAATNVASGVIGNDNVQAIQQRLGSGNFKNLSRFNNFNPLKDMGGKTMGQRVGQLGKNIGGAIGEGARIGGSDFPDKLGGAFRQGKLTPRAENIAAIRKEKEEKVKAIDSKITSIDNQLKNPNLSQAERAELNRQKKDLQKEKWNVQNPPVPGQAQALPAANGTATPATTGTATPNATAQPTAKPAAEAAATTGAAAAAAMAPKMANAVPNGKEATPKSPLTPEQTKQVITNIENEMRAVEKEMNEPATRLNKNRMQELEGKYNNLDSERKGVNSGTILPARLKSFAGNPISDGAPKKTFGEGNTDGSWKTDLNLTQQDRVLRKALEKQGRMEQKASAIAKSSSKTSNLLSGIAAGAAIVPEPNHDDFDQSGMIETPNGMDFGGMGIPEPDHEDMTPLPQNYHTEEPKSTLTAGTGNSATSFSDVLKTPESKNAASILMNNLPAAKKEFSAGIQSAVQTIKEVSTGQPLTHPDGNINIVSSTPEYKPTGGLLDQYGTPTSKPNTTSQSNIITGGPTPNPNAQIKSANDFKRDDASNRPPLII